MTSVILCTFNQAVLLRRVLHALANQTLPHGAFEVVEPTNSCSLQCPLCLTGSGTACRTQGSLAPELFDRILEDCAPTPASEGTAV